MDGFLNLNKPLGLTSHDCVAKLRRILQTKKIGHAGTLDPAAAGVLPIAIGRVTRLLQYLPGDKAYHATVRFGVTTDSDDREGKILTQVPVPHLSRAIVEQALPQFQGHIQQVPPAFSAIQVGGKRLYELARAGQKVDVPLRQVKVHSLEVLDWRSGEFPEIDLAIHCGPGTYIRSIARDLGQVVGTGATLVALCRTESSGFRLEDSLTLEQVANLVEVSELALVPPIAALAGLEKLELPDDLARRWCFGQKIIVDALPHLQPQAALAYRVHNSAQAFLGITQLEPVESGWRLLPQMVYQINQ